MNPENIARLYALIILTGATVYAFYVVLTALFPMPYSILVMVAFFIGAIYYKLD